MLLAISAALNIIYIRARVSGGAAEQARPDTVRLVDTLRFVRPVPVHDTIVRYVRGRLLSTQPAFSFSSHLAAQIQRFARLFFMHPKIFSKKWVKYLDGKNIYTTFASSKQTNNNNSNLIPTQHG